ncbi:hypothetical protein HPB47_009847, partial [Ixodes persulcatus]
MSAIGRAGRALRFEQRITVAARLQFSAPTFLPDRNNAVLVNEYGNHRDEAHPQHECAAHLLENHAPSWVIEMAWTTSASTSSSRTAAPPRDNYIYGWNHLAALSEHGITLTMRTTHFVFMLVKGPRLGSLMGMGGHRFESNSTEAAAVRDALCSSGLPVVRLGTLCPLRDVAGDSRILGFFSSPRTLHPGLLADHQGAARKLWSSQSHPVLRLGEGVGYEWLLFFRRPTCEAVRVLTRAYLRKANLGLCPSLKFSGGSSCGRLGACLCK